MGPLRVWKQPVSSTLQSVGRLLRKTQLLKKPLLWSISQPMTRAGSLRSAFQCQLRLKPWWMKQVMRSTLRVLNTEKCVPLGLTIVEWKVTKMCCWRFLMLVDCWVWFQRKNIFHGSNCFASKLLFYTPWYLNVLCTGKVDGIVNSLHFWHYFVILKNSSPCVKRDKASSIPEFFQQSELLWRAPRLKLKCYGSWREEKVVSHTRVKFYGFLSNVVW